MINEKKKILFLMKLVPISGVVIISLILIFLFITGINNYFEQEIENTENEITYKTIHQAREDIKSLYALIDNIDQRVKTFYKKDIKNVVELGYKFLNNIYETNRNYPKDIIIQKIKDNFRNIRFYDDKSGYFFIYDMKGNLILLPPNPELEGKNLFNYKDIKGKYVIKDFITKLKNSPNGIFDEWHYYKPNTTCMEKKLGYAKYFKPLDIFIGSAVYYDNLEKEIYKRFLNIILKMNLVNNNDLIILHKNGKVFYSLEKELLNKDFSLVYKDILDSLNGSKVKILEKNNNLYIYSFYKDLELVILNKIDLKELHNKIIAQKEDIKNVISSVVKQFVMISLLFIVLIIVISFYLIRLIEKVFNKYERELIKQKDKAQQALKVKSEFLANMSHEIRTPLNAMFGFIKILKEKENDKETQKYLNIIEKSGENLLTIINDILDLSKLEAGKFKIEHIEFNPKEEIEVIYNLFVSKADEKNIALKIEEKNLKFNIVTDPTRLKQVIANLLSNAIKFTPQNKNVLLKIEYNDKKEKLFIKVIDEGIGIAKERLKHIFDAFAQADSSTTRKYGGTGLGLTISYKLVKLLGGELKVKSRINKGSCFYFSIPAQKGEVIQVKKDKKTEDLDEKFDFYILLVEDNIANQMFMKVILKKMGIKFDIANDGVEAIEKFQKNSYDYILMDENMPNMNGIKATQKIRQIEKKENLKRTIIIALTANALEEDEKRFLQAGMDFYLSKPLDITKLKEIFKKTRGDK